MKKHEMKWYAPTMRYPGVHPAWPKYIARNADGTTTVFEFLPFFDEDTGSFRDYNGLPGRTQVIAPMGLPRCYISRIDEVSL